MFWKSQSRRLLQNKMKTFRHIGIVVDDLKKTIYFYRDLMGLKIESDKIEKGEFIGRILGVKGIKARVIKLSGIKGGLVELLYFSRQQRKKIKNSRIDRFGYTHFAVTVGNIDKEYIRLKKKRVSFISAPGINPAKTAKVAFCRDYDGNLIELVEVLK